MSKVKCDRHRTWVFTVNNWTNKDRQCCIDLKTAYLVFGEEICPSTGTPHLQGYVTLKSACTRSSLSKKMPRASLKVANGTEEENQIYCSKEMKNVFERGKPCEQGKRTDHDEIKEIIDNGGKLLDCFEANFGLTVRNYRGYERYIQLKQKKRMEMPTIIWRWGDANTGKTRWVYDTFGVDNVFTKPEGWYDGYEHETCFLIDDFDQHTMGDKELLRLLDRYPFQGQVKGTFVHINSPTMVITSDLPPQAFWPIGNKLDQVLKRITEVIHVQ